MSELSFPETFYDLLASESVHAFQDSVIRPYNGINSISAITRECVLAEIRLRENCRGHFSAHRNHLCLGMGEV